MISQTREEGGEIKRALVGGGGNICFVILLAG